MFKFHDELRTAMSELTTGLPKVTELHRTSPYTLARIVFQKLDQEVAFAIDSVRKSRLAKPDASNLEAAVRARLSAYENLTQAMGAGVQVQMVERSKEELRWVLEQLRR